MAQKQNMETLLYKKPDLSRENMYRLKPTLAL